MRIFSLSPILPSNPNPNRSKHWLWVLFILKLIIQKCPAPSRPSSVMLWFAEQLCQFSHHPNSYLPAENVSLSRSHIKKIAVHVLVICQRLPLIFRLSSFCFVFSAEGLSNFDMNNDWILRQKILKISRLLFFFSFSIKIDVVFQNYCLKKNVHYLIEFRI